MTQTAPAKIRVMYDGLCPMCSREISFLQGRCSDDSVVFEDIADPKFDPAKFGLTMDEVIGSMHAVRTDGTVLRGVDVFIEVYRHCRLNWLADVLAFRPARPVFDFFYRVFARIRPWFSKLDREACNDRCPVVTKRMVS